MLNYRKIFLSTVFISAIICAALTVLAILFLPEKPVQIKNSSYDKTVIFPLEITYPVKNLPTQKEKDEPDTIRTFIRDKTQSYKLPEDVRKNLTVADHNPNVNSQKTNSEHKNFAGVAVDKGNNSGGSAANPAQQNAIPSQSMPRLIYEEVPSGLENKFNGNLQLSLKINEDGQVVEYKILSNSLDCTDCLNAIIQAAYKSKWEPAVIDGKKKEYWVVKSYTFK